MLDFNTAQEGQPGGLYKGLLISLLFNIGIPLLLYYLAKSYLHASEIVALSVACIFPVVSNIVEIIRHRRLDFFGLLFLVGAIVSTALTLLGGSPQLILIRESMVTGAYGLLCFISLLFFPRPLMFYMGRQMMTGGNPARIAQYDAAWQKPQGRAAHRLITAVWGCALFGEFVLRVVIALLLPPPVVLVLGPILLTVAIGGTFFWMFGYIRRARARAQQAPEQAN
jgi:intracellular septation protein A